MRGVIAEAELSGCMGSRFAAGSVNYDLDDPMGMQMQIESIQTTAAPAPPDTPTTPDTTDTPATPTTM